MTEAVPPAEQHLRTAFGEAVQRRRLQMQPKLSQVDLAYKVGVHPQTITFIEGGKRGSSDKVKLAIADALGVELRDLLPDGQEAKAS